MFKQVLSVFTAAAAPLLVTAPSVHAASAADAAFSESSAVEGACRASRPHRAGTTAYRIKSGGMDRQYLLYVPKRYDGTSRLPVVFDFHGSGSNPEEELQVSGMASAAEHHGFLVLLPVAAVPFPLGGYTWNVPPDDRLPDDVRFAYEALRHAARRVCIDEARVYAAGFSGGARLASELACALPSRIAALGAVAGLRAPRGCAGSPVPVVAFHGTRDPINPYFGGGPAYWGYGVEEAVRGWVERNGCETRPVATRMSDSVVKLAHAGCEQEADVVLYRVAGGGHTWPGSRFPFPRERFGTAAPVDASALMLEFFRRHAKPVAARRAQSMH